MEELMSGNEKKDEEAETKKFLEVTEKFKNVFNDRKKLADSIKRIAFILGISILPIISHAQQESGDSVSKLSQKELKYTIKDLEKIVLEIRNGFDTNNWDKVIYFADIAEKVDTFDFAGGYINTYFNDILAHYYWIYGEKYDEYLNAETCKKNIELSIKNKDWIAVSAWAGKIKSKTEEKK